MENKIEKDIKRLVKDWTHLSNPEPAIIEAKNNFDNHLKEIHSPILELACGFLLSDYRNCF